KGVKLPTPGFQGDETPLGGGDARFPAESFEVSGYLKRDDFTATAGLRENQLQEARLHLFRLTGFFLPLEPAFERAAAMAATTSSGVSPTRIPAASKAATLLSAVPTPPDTMAPAWP